MVHARTHKRVVLVCGGQMGKSQSILDVIGERFDTSPAPTLYVGPTRQFIREQWEPRLMELIDGTPLRDRIQRGRRAKVSRKVISGVVLRLAHGGSSVALKSDPFALAITDEADEMMANVKGAGDPIGLIDVRGDTYADFVHYVTSTPSEGPSDVDVDPDSGLEFWAEVDPGEIASTIWRLWQSGTRYHWAWPCPHCGEYFIPRFRQLRWDKPKLADGREGKSDPAVARETAHLGCPRCGCEIRDEDGVKERMNARGVYVAPGQSVTPEGEVVGPAPDAWTISYWVSGLASPFSTWGDRAARYVEAVRSGEPDVVQSVVNGAFGELFAPGSGEVPEWRELERLKDPQRPYRRGEVPEWVVRLSLACDVQKDRLVYGIRGWGARSTSCLIDLGELWGNTADEDVWDELERGILDDYDGLPIHLALIDSGFRPGNPKQVPENRVYSFCQRVRRCHPTKGQATLAGRPVRPSRIEVKVNWRGKLETAGIELLHVDTDHWKRTVHERLRWPVDQPGAFILPDDAPDYYLQQLVSEARVRKPGGRPMWVQRSRENHFFDCFDPETELLTRNGWVNVTEVGMGHEFATVDLKTDLIEYQRPSHVVHRPHDGPMIRIAHRSIDLLVTPNHRMVVSHHQRSKGTAVPEIVIAENLTIWHKIKRSARWVGSTPDFVVLPATARESERRVDPVAWAALAGWFVSEGHLQPMKWNCYRTVFSQNPGPKFDSITGLLDSMGFPWRVSGGRQITVASEQLWRSMQAFMMPGSERGCYRKRVASTLQEMGVDAIGAFIDASIAGDGWVHPSGHRMYATTSRALADDMQSLFFKIGAAASLSVREAAPVRINGKVGGPTEPQYWLSEITTAYSHLRRSDNTPLFSREQYRGTVHCVTVPNGTLIARRNGKTCIVGNCEAMQAAAGWMLGAQRVTDQPAPRRRQGEARAAGAPRPRMTMADYSAALNGR